MIEVLTKLSDLDDDADEARRSLAAAHRAEAEAEAALLEAAGARDAVRAELEAAKAEERAQARRIEQYRKRLDGAIRALETGMADPAAAERQRVQCLEIIDQAETASLMAMELQEEVRVRLAPLEERVAQAEQALARTREEAPGRVAAVEARLAELEAERGPLYESLQHEIRQRYDLLRARKKPPVARVVRGACGRCNTAVQPQALIEIKRGDLKTCSCGRWLAV